MIWLGIAVLTGVLLCLLYPVEKRWKARRRFAAQQRAGLVVDGAWIADNLQSYPFAAWLEGELWVLRSRDDLPVVVAPTLENCRRVDPASEAAVLEFLEKGGRRVERHRRLP